MVISILKRGGRWKKSHLGTPLVHMVFVTIQGLTYAPSCFLHRLQCFSAQAFLGTLAVVSVPGCLLPFFLAVQSFLVRRSVGSFLVTHMLNSLERQEKWTHVHGSHTFLVKVELILPHVWHSKNVTCQISLSKGCIHGNCGCLHARAVVPAGQLWVLGVELLHTLHKLTNADALGFLEHVHDVVPLLLSRTVG